jgi:hypothetical protein
MGWKSIRRSLGRRNCEIGLKSYQNGRKIFVFLDTVGNSTPDVISYLFSNLIPQYPVEFGAHLHTTPDKWFEKIGCLSWVAADLMGYSGIWRLSYG